MAHQCTICYNDFSFDPSALNKALLPVQSRVCSHVLCFGCVVAIYRNNQQAPPRPFQDQSSPRSITGYRHQQQEEEEDDTTVDDDDTYASTVKHHRQEWADSIPCPECRLPNAHNPFKPIVNRSLCELLTERQKIIKMVPEGTYSDDNDGGGVAITTPRSSSRVVVEGSVAANDNAESSPRQLSPTNSLNNRKRNRSLPRNNNSHQQQIVMLASNLADTAELIASLARHYMDQMIAFLQVKYEEEQPFLVSHVSQVIYWGSYYLFWGGTGPGSSGTFLRHER